VSHRLKSDTRARSLAKTLVYRVAAVLLLAAVTFVFTGNLGETTFVTVVFNAAGAAVYYGLERAWDRTDWGRETERLAQYPYAAMPTREPQKRVRNNLIDERSPA